MDLTHSFTVPVDVATAWAAFQDITGVAECFPGAAVTSVEGDQFEGTCKVKLGPVALQYAGSGVFLERDEAARRMVLEAKGRDKRGNGTAGALVTADFVEVEPTSTRVEVVTDLQITGKPAQFGRGVMQDVSDKLLAQFVTCLESRVGGAEAEPTPTYERVVASNGVPAPGAAAGSARGAASEAPAGAGAGAGAGGSTPPAAAEAPARPPRAAAGEDAIDLGATVLPVLARTYGPWVGLVLAIVLLLRWVTRRRR